MNRRVLRVVTKRWLQTIASHRFLMHTNVAASRLVAISDIHNYIDHVIPLHDFALYSGVFVLK